VGSARIDALARAWRRLRNVSIPDIWDVEVSSLSLIRRAAVKTLRVLHLIFRGFLEHECPLRASALTFSTMMSIVPILALSLALARGFGGEDVARERIRASVRNWTRTFSSPQPAPPQAGVPSTVPAATAPAADTFNADRLATQIEQAVDQAFDKIQRVNFAALGGIGLAILILSVVMVLVGVEDAFNRVWGVQKGRRPLRKFTDYLSAVLVLPFLLMLATSLPVADLTRRLLAPEVSGRIEGLAGSPFGHRAIALTMTAVLFTFLIKFMPNTRVRARPAIAGGICSTLLFVAWLALCAWLQIGVAGYGRLYGSLALVPIVLAWMYVSWEIVLLGAEVAFALQNADTYRMEQGADKASVEARLTLALAVLTDATRDLLAGRGAFDAARFARARRIPARLLNSVLRDLTDLRFLGELGDQPGRYALLRPPESVTVRAVSATLLTGGVGPEAFGFAGLEHAVRVAVAHAVRDEAAPNPSPTLAALAAASNTEH
jgi:membrane protein